MDNFLIAQLFPEWQPRAISKRVQRLNDVLRSLGFWATLAPPDWTGNTSNIEQRMNLWHLFTQVLAYGVPGDVVELGCFEGQVSVLLESVLNRLDSSRVLHLFDSFEGIPAPSAKDEDTPYTAGSLRTNEDVVRDNFKRLGLRLPVIHKGWFSSTLPTQLPETIAFAYLDGDLYESIAVSLEHVYPRLAKGAICLVDDYCDPKVYPSGWNKLPGVKTACDEYLKDKPEEMTYIYSGKLSHAFFRKA